jgi:hypothetical protein
LFLLVQTSSNYGPLPFVVSASLERVKKPISDEGATIRLNDSVRMSTMVVVVMMAGRGDLEFN